MRIFLIVIILSVWMFPCCEKISYDYLDKNSYYAFGQGDTLVYKGVSVTDTFYVASINKNFRNVDKRVNIEQLIIHIPELTINCKDSTYNYCLGISILRDAVNFTSVSFRNDFSSSVESSPVGSYKIGETLINDVYSVNFNIKDMTNPKNVAMIHYTHKYGIIAYELVNGEKVELEEKYFQ